METRTQLNEIRQERGISASQLAKHAGVSRQTIYAIEAGDYVPNTALALQLAKLLEVRVEDLFQLENDAPSVPAPVAVDLLEPGCRKKRPAGAALQNWKAHRGRCRNASAAHASDG